MDLGLSVKWASHNMGANNPENIGTSLQQCYAFNNFNKNNVKFDLLSEWPEEEYFSFIPDGVDDDNWLGNSNYDVATRTLGSGYCIPTEQEWKELEDECNWKSGVYNSVKGFYVSDRIDGTKVIFLPYVKKSSKYDMTVYLSAYDYLISNIRKELKLAERYLSDMSNPHFTSDQLLQIDVNFCDNIRSIEKNMGGRRGVDRKRSYILQQWSCPAS